jgi:succinate dehydrogenase hydrophobic anchor subunit
VTTHKSFMCVVLRSCSHRSCMVGSHQALHLNLLDRLLIALQLHAYSGARAITKDVCHFDQALTRV